MSAGTGQLDIEVFLTDRDAYTVTTTLLDHNIWDLTRAKHKWPDAREAPLTWLGFLAWSASRRTGRIEPSVTWELFLGDCLSVRRPEEDEDTAPVGPTQVAAGQD